jgi:hypothetical protein
MHIVDGEYDSISSCWIIVEEISLQRQTEGKRNNLMKDSLSKFSRETK